MRIISTLVAVLFVLLSSVCQAQYFAPAFGLNGAPLKTALHQIISNHTDKGWPLWPYFYKTDSLPVNRVWDIYSDNPIRALPTTCILALINVAPIAKKAIVITTNTLGQARFSTMPFL